MKMYNDSKIFLIIFLTDLNLYIILCFVSVMMLLSRRTDQHTESVGVFEIHYSFMQLVPQKNYSDTVHRKNNEETQLRHVHSR